WANFPTYHALQPTFVGTLDAFVTKLSQDGSAFVYSTYLGGTEAGQVGYGIAADAAGDAYVSGITYCSDFPTTPESYQPEYKGEGDAFVSKLKPDGSGFVSSTFLGGSQSESAYAIAVDAAGQAYLMGTTHSTDFPTVNAFQPTFGGAYYDAFVAKLTAQGKTLSYASFVGGSGDEAGLGIALDRFGNAYGAGFTNSTDFPLVKPLQSSKGGGWDAYVIKVSRYAVDPVTPKPV